MSERQLFTRLRQLVETQQNSDDSTLLLQLLRLCSEEQQRQQELNGTCMQSNCFNSKMNLAYAVTS